jgi:hypothetical protein
MSVAGGCIPPAVPNGDAAVMGGDPRVKGDKLIKEYSLSLASLQSPLFQ